MRRMNVCLVSLFVCFSLALGAAGTQTMTEFGHSPYVEVDTGAFLTGVSGPVSIAIGPSGEIYIAESYKHRVVVFKTPYADPEAWGWGVSTGAQSLEIETFVKGTPGPSGIGGPGDGQMSYPTGIAVDSVGNVYVADGSNRRVVKFNDQGAFLLAWGWGVEDGSDMAQTCTQGCLQGIGGTTQGRMTGPTAIAISPVDDSVYVADTASNRVLRFDQDGKFLDERKFGEPLDSSGGLHPIGNIALDSSGALIVADIEDSVIHRWEHNAPSKQTINPQLQYSLPTTGFAVSSGPSGEIVVWNPLTVGDGLAILLSENGGAYDVSDVWYFQGTLPFPIAFANDKAGDLYVACRTDGSLDSMEVRELLPARTISLQVLGGPATVPGPLQLSDCGTGAVGIAPECEECYEAGSQVVVDILPDPAEFAQGGANVIWEGDCVPDPTDETKATVDLADDCGCRAIVYENMYTVNTIADTSWSTVNKTPCEISAPGCTLRAAITLANETTAADRIVFDLPVAESVNGLGAYWQIDAVEPMTVATKPIIIDGLTQVGALPGAPVVVVNGALASANSFSYGMAFKGGSSLIRGLILNGWDHGHDGTADDAAALLVSELGGNVVESCFIGTDHEGTSVVANRSGLNVDSPQNLIGGLRDTTGNLISGNARYGIRVNLGKPGNVIQGNTIGPAVDGVTLLKSTDTSINASTGGKPYTGNGDSAVRIELFNGFELVSEGYTLPSLLIGGLAQTQENVISGNTTDGVHMTCSIGAKEGLVFLGNLVGLAGDGVTPMGNGRNGLWLSGQHHRIGNLDFGGGNSICGNAWDGIYVPSSGTGWITIQGNYIGTNHESLEGLGNDWNGIHFHGIAGNIYRGNLVDANVISGNHEHGVLFTQASAVFTRNLVGTGTSSLNPFGFDLGNGLDGVHLSLDTGATGVWGCKYPALTRVQVGGTDPALGNHFANNGQAGIAVDNGRQCPILSNTFTANGWEAIDIRNSGCDDRACDDQGDKDCVLNYPEISGASLSLSGVLTVEYSVDSPSWQLSVGNQTASSDVLLIQFYLGTDFPGPLAIPCPGCPQSQPCPTVPPVTSCADVEGYVLIGTATYDRIMGGTQTATSDHPVLADPTLKQVDLLATATEIASMLQPGPAFQVRTSEFSDPVTVLKSP